RPASKSPGRRDRARSRSCGVGPDGVDGFLFQERERDPRDLVCRGALAVGTVAAVSENDEMVPAPVTTFQRRSQILELARLGARGPCAVNHQNWDLEVAEPP